jgi:circadian clock protein KaiC
MSIKSSGGQNSRCTVGIDGLDDVLGGGVPRNRIYLVQGDPGVGKTTLALQFLLEGARVGKPLTNLQGVLTGTPSFVEKKTGE